ncbi:MAG TPA: hypothetical protein VMA74_20750 [Dyella sp.]|uniref:hypothetical protein n=1 Tax=Dyella sp. TaxID=1869338 RepID=UPI002C6BB8E2|nr:hypothetical protein [Dyella sp.]HUB92166.1 hypothetical protein [Dyella sp.]
MNPLAQAPPVEAAQRLAVCRTCSERGFAPVIKSEICKKCGCFLIAKTKLLDSHCPLNKW